MMKSLLVILTLVVTLGAIGMVNAQDYVGPERCLQCHNNSGLGDMTGWRSSFHANGYSYVPDDAHSCLLYTSPSPRDGLLSRMPSSA